MKLATVPAQLLDWLDGVRELVVCDACQSGLRVGTLRRWSWPADSLPVRARAGSHDLSLPFVLELASRLGKLPQHVTIWGIELGDAAPGNPLTDTIRAAVPRVAQTIARELIEQALQSELS
jgi:hydrogenase maturation protease